MNPEKANWKIKGDRWRLAKNPPMAKLVFFFFFDSKYKGSIRMNYLLVDECLYSTHETITSF